MSIARELHDELGQTLTAMKLELARAISALKSERVRVAAVDRLQSLVGLSEISIATVKRITSSLRPPALDHLGLAEAIRGEAVMFAARTGLRCRVKANDRPTGLTLEQEIAAFRILQEALTNVVRHARASTVLVTLTRRGNQVELRIRDNGRGISDGQARDPRAIGLLGMRERAALAGFVFGIAGAPGRGTVVQVLGRVAPASRRPHSRQTPTPEDKR